MAACWWWNSQAPSEYCRRPIPRPIPRHSCNSPTSDPAATSSANNREFTTSHSIRTSQPTTTITFSILSERPNVDRFSRFTANATLTGTIAGSEFVIYQDPEIANAEHHGGAINFSNDGKILLTTGEHFNPGEAQDLTKPRGKILRFNMDGTIPTDNPFYDGAGPNYDAIWALGLRNPFRAYYDAPTGRLIIGDVGGNIYSTAIEEIDIGARGRQLRLAERRSA